MGYKHDYDKTLTRLITIISKLHQGEALSVKTLAEEFNVSERTVQRDFNDRLIHLYPIYKEKKRWKMHDGFSFEKSASVEETIVLDILEKLSDGLGTQFSSKAKTLLSKIKNSDLNPMYAKLPMENISDQLHNISQLEEAIVSKYTITCLYDFSTSKKKLELKPLKIANFDGFWYLIALDARNDKLKKYHLKSISNINLLTTQFRTTKKLEVSLDNAINIWFEPEHDPMEVELLLDAHAAKILKRKPIARSQRTLEEYRDGSVEISIMITHEMEILPIVKYWIPHIKIISPKALQERLLADIEKFHHEIKQT